MFTDTSEFNYLRLRLQGNAGKIYSFDESSELRGQNPNLDCQ